MRLFIAEKPSVGRSIAAALGKYEKEGASALKCNDGRDIVTWAAGHILANAAPDEYNPAWKKWDTGTLPMIPSEWKKTPRKDAAQLLNNIGQLLKHASEVVNAGDSDREGQLLIDEILEYHKYSGPVKRLLITDTTPGAIRKSIAAMKDNSAYAGLKNSAEARERADWLLGLNLTRLYTLRAGNRAVLSIGRVQTPTLGLVVKRDEEIDQFKPTPFWDVEAKFLTPEGETFTALWQPKEKDGDADDADISDKDTEDETVVKHCADHNVVTELLERLKGQRGKIVSAKTAEKRLAPPLPPSLSSLQVECNQRYGLSAARTLEVLQSLYEAGVTSYPRSDCRYLPTERLADAPRVINVISAACPDFAIAAAVADPSRKTSAWNDKKVAEHFAIIPTGKIPDALKDDEAKVFAEVARRYLALFLNDHEYKATTLLSEVGGESFKSAGKIVTNAGWKILYQSDGNTTADSEEQSLPNVSENTDLHVVSLKELEKTTKAPPRYTEATLIKAMNGIHKYVSDPELKKTLKEVDGIGTAATQAGIIETLCSRGYIVRQGKALVSQEIAKKLLSVVSKEIATPDLTAVFEQKMAKIRDGSLSLGDFMDYAQKMTLRLVRAGMEVTIPFSAPPAPNGKGSASAAKAADSGHVCPKCKGALRRIKGKNGFFWACQSCGATFNDSKGKPETVYVCPRCGGLVKRHKSQYGFFWSCSDIQCGTIFKEKNGRPVFNVP